MPRKSRKSKSNKLPLNGLVIKDLKLHYYTNDLVRPMDNAIEGTVCFIGTGDGGFVKSLKIETFGTPILVESKDAKHDCSYKITIERM